MTTIATDLSNNNTTVKVTEEELDKIAKLLNNQFYIWVGSEWMWYSSFLSL